jgi:hypothetical protein
MEVGTQRLGKRLRRQIERILRRPRIDQLQRRIRLQFPQPYNVSAAT